MKDQHTFDSIVTGIDEFDQGIEIARLKDWLGRVSQRPSQDLLCRGLGKFVELDLLRYGFYRGRRGFVAVQQSRELQDFINHALWSMRPAIAALLDLLAERKVVVDTGERNGRPEFIFNAVCG